MRTARILAVCCLLAAPLGAQTTTPNIGLEVPATGGTNWQTQLNYNWNLLDGLIPAKMAKSANLSDLASLSTALANLLGNPASGTYSIVCSSTTSCTPTTATTGADDGFPLTIGSTSVAAHSTTTSVSGLTVDGVSPSNLAFLLANYAAVALPTSGTMPYLWCSTPIGGAGQVPAWCLGGVGGRTVSGTTDTIAATDRGQSVLYTNTAAVAVSLPDPSTLGSNFVFVAQARAGSGLITFTAAAGTFLNSSSGTATTQVMTPGETCSLSTPDNTNYLARCAAAPNLAVYTVAALPSASTVGAGAQMLVTDSASFTPGTCTGSGSNAMIAVSDGTNWSCH